MLKSNKILLDSIFFEYSSSSYRIRALFSRFIDSCFKFNLLILETGTPKLEVVNNKFKCILLVLIDTEPLFIKYTVIIVNT